MPPFTVTDDAVHLKTTHALSAVGIGLDNSGNLHVNPAVSIAPVAGTTDTSEITAQLTGNNSATGLVARIGENTAYIDVTITPVSTGLKQWELSIASNDPDEPVVKVVVSVDVR